MIQEHAITYQDHLSLENIEYITKKANKLGRVGRNVVAVHEEIRTDGVHVYFNVTERQER